MSWSWPSQWQCLLTLVPVCFGFGLGFGLSGQRVSFLSVGVAGTSPCRSCKKQAPGDQKEVRASGAGSVVCGLETLMRRFAIEGQRRVLRSRSIRGPITLYIFSKTT